MIERLFKLEILNGSYNQINEFPDFLSKLNQIKEINLEGFISWIDFLEYNKWIKITNNIKLGNQLTNQGNQISQFIQFSNSIQNLLYFFFFLTFFSFHLLFITKQLKWINQIGYMVIHLNPKILIQLFKHSWDLIKWIWNLSSLFYFILLFF